MRFDEIGAAAVASCACKTPNAQAWRFCETVSLGGNCNRGSALGTNRSFARRVERVRRAPPKRCGDDRFTTATALPEPPHRAAFSYLLVLDVVHALHGVAHVFVRLTHVISLLLLFWRQQRSDLRH